MAEADSDNRNAMEDEDLEDGEIETDEENEEVKPTKPMIEPVKKPKPTEDDIKKIIDAKIKNEQHSKPVPDSNAAKSKKQLASETAAKGK